MHMYIYPSAINKQSKNYRVIINGRAGVYYYKNGNKIQVVELSVTSHLLVIACGSHGLKPVGTPFPDGLKAL